MPADYGMTHPAPKYYYLKDRRPELYKKLVSEKVDFINTNDEPINPDTDLLDGGFEYPVSTDGKENPKKIND